MNRFSHRKSSQKVTNRYNRYKVKVERQSLGRYFQTSLISILLHIDNLLYLCKEYLQRTLVRMLPYVFSNLLRLIFLIIYKPTFELYKNSYRFIERSFTCYFSLSDHKTMRTLIFQYFVLTFCFVFLLLLFFGCSFLNRLLMRAGSIFSPSKRKIRDCYTVS